MALFVINMIYFKILKTYIFIHQNLIFYQSVPLIWEDSEQIHMHVALRIVFMKGGAGGEGSTSYKGQR